MTEIELLAYLFAALVIIWGIALAVYWNYLAYGIKEIGGTK
jgi:hypothetical protein